MLHSIGPGYEKPESMSLEEYANIGISIIDEAVLSVLKNNQHFPIIGLTQGQITKKLNISPKTDTHPHAAYHLTVRDSLFRLLAQGKVQKHRRYWRIV